MWWPQKRLGMLCVKCVRVPAWLKRKKEFQLSSKESISAVGDEADIVIGQKMTTKIWKFIKKVYKNWRKCKRVLNFSHREEFCWRLSEQKENRSNQKRNGSGCSWCLEVASGFFARTNSQSQLQFADCLSIIRRSTAAPANEIHALSAFIAKVRCVSLDGLLNSFRFRLQQANA